MSLMVTIEDAEGELLATAFELQALQRKFPPAQEGSSPCLRFISDTADSSVNETQLPFLAAELEKLATENLKPAERVELDKLAAACKTAQSRKGLYLRFYAE